MWILLGKMSSDERKENERTLARANLKLTTNEENRALFLIFSVDNYLES